MTLALRFAARSHTGLLREGNEDSVYAGPRLLVVADGMGGHAAGEVASAVAVATLAPLDEDDPPTDLLAALREATEQANGHLRDMIAGDPALDGMGTTTTALLFAGTRLGLLHVGDSRCYLLRDGALTQITADHTLVQRLVDEGRISEEEASTHPQRSMVTRVLTGHDVELDLSVREARAGDRYLLCSDGLTGPVASRDTLQDALQIPDPQDSCDRLVSLALRGGGPDNITVIVADVVEAASAGPVSPVVVAGAAAEHPQAPPPGSDDSPAGRARVAEGRNAGPSESGAAARADDAAPRRGRRLGRTALVAGLAVLLLALSAGAGWAYVQSQYYVGLDDQQVAVYRGVTGSVGGLRLSSVEARTDLDAERLDPLVRERVERGIVASDRGDADRIITRLEEEAEPLCEPVPEPAATPDPASSPTPTASPVAAGTPAGTPAAAPTPAAAVDPRCPDAAP